ncbi:hypothetical protein EXIGLDRAFT_745608 [Exidia glandulosa HHB12029]|uniref:Ricin B lectin domain-containing protein n=1 Tax=Exidia glandulosa HHB12029 TaxID=1314781 RepID=A0A165NDM7_EXIGL|nr:hypothetical protein EXIGLDRAFT_745608 [Exidia glandulosa HHB12029]
MNIVLTSTRLFHILVAICTLRGQAHAGAAVPQARIDPSSAYDIISVANGAYVDVTTDAQDFDHFYLVASPSNFETAWYLWDPPTGTNEKGTYTIVHFVIEYGVTVDNSTQGPNPLRLATRNNDRLPLPLQVVPAGGGEYVVKVANKDLLWTLYGDENKIQLLPATGEKTQHWRFVETENT